MPAYVFGTTKPPTTPVPILNGKIPDTQLKDVGDGRGKMLALPAEAMGYLHIMMLQRGYKITTTGRYRSYAQQVSLFLQRWSETRQYNFIRNGVPQYVTTTWNGKTWYLKTGAARAAKPGTSPHGMGCADDVAELRLLPNGTWGTFSLSNACLDVLIEVAPICGFKWQATTQTPVERWHLQWVMGDALPPAVQWFRAVKAAAEQAKALPVVKLGTTNTLAAEVQKIINADTGTSLKIDGNFGPYTLAAWNNFALKYKLPADQMVDDKVDWDTLAWVGGGWERLFAAGYPRP